MNFRAIISVFLTITSGLSFAQSQGAKKDILRFKNGDQLHGTLHGISDGPSIIWNREDLTEQVEFKATDIRQIVLQAPRSESLKGGFSHLGTVNGDRIPGVVRQLNNETVLLETTFGKLLEIPRNRVGLIAPQPLGGRILYHGPFTQNEWDMVARDHPQGLPLEDNEAEKDDLPRWAFSGSAWYWDNGEVGTALVRKSGLPDRAMLQFEIAWKGRLSLAIGIHSNFNIPEAEENEDEDLRNARRGRSSNSLPHIFGDSYVLHIYSNYMQLYRTGFDDGGKPIVDRLEVSNGEIRLNDSGSAKIEIRCSKVSGELMLFINDEFVMQWNEPATAVPANQMYAGKGSGFGFLVQSSKSPVKISEVVVAEWNGMPDAARSMQIDKSDIVLLTNGVDRFSGKVTSIKNQELNLKGRYGNFIFPMDEIAEVRFANKGLIVPEAPSKDSVMVRLTPIGRITGQPLTGPIGKIRLLNQAAGEIDIDLNSAAMLEFESPKTFIDDWNIEF